ncbi:MAG TPA: hypothetical protein VHX17_00655 [Candidatus Cybelea sp.]|jgi:stalled ribosome rescue protein Dom34|nr:hypothetical protein [Candidatus Cybelea sp.]
MIVTLIDHQSARFFEAGPSGGFVESGRLEPLDPHGFRRHLEHRKEADYSGQRVPEADEFYERIAQHLKNARAIVLLGDGKGKSSAMHYLLAYLKERHAEIAARVKGAQDADLSAITLGEIDDIARRYTQ